MKKFALSIIFILLSLYLSNAQDNLYQVSRIKTSLKKGVDAVIRSEQMTLDIISMQKAVMHYKRVVTIFNEDADQYAMITVRYDKFSKITRLAGYGYSANGDREVSLKATNILDISAVDGNLLYSDDRMKIAAIPFYKYPYTIEFEYILEMDGRINYPEQVFGGFEKISVEHSGMQITTPLNTELRYVERNLKHPVEIIKNNKNIIYIWQEDFIPVFRQDPFTIPLVEKQPFVITAPDKFEIADYSGDMSSWKSTGEWINKLNAGRMDLPEDIVATVRSLIAIAKNDREKVEILYKYMQSTTRYVAVFLGIGGLQPEPASKVSSTGYGDCKAL